MGIAGSGSDTPGLAHSMNNPTLTYNEGNTKASLFDGRVTLSHIPTLGHHIYAGTALLTPELAEYLLENQNRNREPLNQTRIDRYCQDMVNDQWKLSVQGIQLDNLARMIDGQHRCHAAIRASKITGEEQFNPPEVLFSLGFSTDSMLVIDTGLPRRATHSATIAGEFFREGTDIKIRPAHEAIMVAMVTKWDSNGKVPVMSSISKIEAIQKFADPIEWVLQNPCGRYFDNAAVRGVLAAAFYRNRNDATILQKIDEFKVAFDRPYNPHDWRSGSKYIDLNDPATNALLLRHVMEERKKAKSAGAAFRLETARMTGQALTQYLEDTAPLVNRFTNGAASTTYQVPLFESAPWNDSTWANLLKG